MAIRRIGVLTGGGDAPGLNPAIRALVWKAAEEGIEAVGFVEDLEPWLARCRVSISPLRYGAGVKGKVNQAMSRGLPVVATAMSVEGMHLVPGEEVLVADERGELKKGDRQASRPRSNCTAVLAACLAAQDHDLRQRSSADASGLFSAGKPGARASAATIRAMRPGC